MRRDPRLLLREHVGGCGTVSIEVTTFLLPGVESGTNGAVLCGDDHRNARAPREPDERLRIFVSRPVPVTHVDRLLRIGKDGVVTQRERVLLRQIGLDKVAIPQVVKETRDGGRLTRAEAQQIMRGYRARNQKTDAELLDEICKRSPLYPPCKNR